MTRRVMRRNGKVRPIAVFGNRNVRNPFVPGAARIYRIAGGVRTVYATGLTNVTDLA